MDTDQGGSTDVPWLSEDRAELALAPGASGVVTVTLNAADPSVAQPGTYLAALTPATDAHYQVPEIPVSMTVSPPPTWGKDHRNGDDGRVDSGARRDSRVGQLGR